MILNLLRFIKNCFDEFNPSFRYKNGFGCAHNLAANSMMKKIFVKISMSRRQNSDSPFRIATSKKCFFFNLSRFLIRAAKLTGTLKTGKTKSIS